MTRRAEAHQHQVTERSLDRQEADTQRAQEIFAAFRRNLRESLAQIRAGRGRAGDDAVRPTTSRLSAAATSGPWRNGSPASTTRNAARSPAIAERYADIRPHVTAAAVVFALTADDAKSGKIG